MTTCHCSYGMRPSLPARPAFARYGSMRQQHEPSSGDESNDDNGVNGQQHDDGSSDQLSVSFSEVDDTDSINEITSVKETTIEEEEEVDSNNPTPIATPAKTLSTKPPLPASEPLSARFKPQSQGSVNGSTRQTPVFQKSPSSETVKCNVVLKPPSVSATLPTTPVVAQQHKVPLVPGGFVGFASLPDQVYR